MWPILFVFSVASAMVTTALMRHDFLLNSGAGGLETIKDSPSSTGKFLWVTDTHVNPYYGINSTPTNQYGNYGSDPSFKMVESLVNGAENLGAEFVVFTGDFSRHNPEEMPDPEHDVLNVIKDVSDEIKRASSTDLWGPVGNDDSPQSYWLRIPYEGNSSRWLTSVGTELQISDEFHYGHGGFYERQCGGITFLALNTLIYSHYHIPNETIADPFGQFKWLRQKLKEAVEAARTVWIIGHVPPGMETYGYTPLWKEEYVVSYLNIVEDSFLSSCIGAQLFGHTHRHEFRVLQNAPNSTGPLLIGGAVSPVFDNNPNFIVVEYSRTNGKMLNYQFYYTELIGNTTLNWHKGFDALDIFPVLRSSTASKGITNKHVKELTKELVHDDDTWLSYAMWYAGKYRNEYQICSDQQDAEQKWRCKISYVCAMSEALSTGYSSCMTTAKLPGHLSTKPTDRVMNDANIREYIEMAHWEHWSLLGVNVSLTGKEQSA